MKVTVQQVEVEKFKKVSYAKMLCHRAYRTSAAFVPSEVCPISKFPVTFCDGILIGEGTIFPRFFIYLHTELTVTMNLLRPL